MSAVEESVDLDSSGDESDGEAIADDRAVTVQLPIVDFGAGSPDAVLCAQAQEPTLPSGFGDVITPEEFTTVVEGIVERAMPAIEAMDGAGLFLSPGWCCASRRASSDKVHEFRAAVRGGAKTARLFIKERVSRWRRHGGSTRNAWR